MKPEPWRKGNRVTLLENGEQFFPRVIAAVERAREELLIETFILEDDSVGQQLQAALAAAARRGVQVTITVDGYGSANLSPEFIGVMTAAGVHVHVYDPQPRFLGMRTNLFRRLHRKLLVADGQLAFIGGINFSTEQLCDQPPEKQDYAVEIDGPLAADVRRLAVSLHSQFGHAPRPGRGSEVRDAVGIAHADGAEMLLVSRDNDHRRNDIERHYRVAIRTASRRVILANAYFLPGYRLLRDLRQAARRGVDVDLILQGHPDMPTVKMAETALYDYLLRGGVRIHEYCKRPFHGKVALVDDEWSTVGSSNLDPLSMWLNLEANVVIRDREFASGLGKRLEQMIRRNCRVITREETSSRRMMGQLFSPLVFHVLRHFPSWAGVVPAHTVRPVSAQGTPPARDRGKA